MTVTAEEKRAILTSSVSFMSGVFSGDGLPQCPLRVEYELEDDKHFSVTAIYAQLSNGLEFDLYLHGDVKYNGAAWRMIEREAEAKWERDCEDGQTDLRIGNYQGSMP